MMLTHPNVEAYVKRLVDFVLAYRKDDTKAYKGWSKEQLEETFRGAVLSTSLASVTDADNNIVAVCNGYVESEKKKIFMVNNILAKPGHMSLLIGSFKILFPGFTLKATRYNREVTYDINRLEAKFKAKHL